MLVTRDAWPVWCKQTAWHRVTRQQWRADTGRIALFVAASSYLLISTLYSLLLYSRRGSVTTNLPGKAAVELQWECQASTRSGQGWCHVCHCAVSACGLLLAELGRNCKVWCRQRSHAQSCNPGTGSLSPLLAPELAAVVPTLMTRHTRPTIAEVVLSAAIVNVMQSLKLRSIGSTKYHSYHQSPHQVTPAAANKKFYFPNLIECRTPPLHWSVSTVLPLPPGTSVPEW